MKEQLVSGPPTRSKIMLDKSSGVNSTKALQIRPGAQTYSTWLGGCARTYIYIYDKSYHTGRISAAVHRLPNPSAPLKWHPRNFGVLSAPGRHHPALAARTAGSPEVCQGFQKLLVEVPGSRVDTPLLKQGGNGIDTD